MSITRFPHGVSSFGIPVFGGNDPSVGNVYFVCQNSTLSWYSEWYNEHYTMYSDNTVNIHSTITSALSAAANDRNDYIIILPDADDYDENATLTISKNNIHLICPAGLGTDYGCVRAATLDPNSAAHAITMSGRGVEVAGLWIRGYTEKLCITASGTGQWIHHNDCAVTCTTSAAGGIYSTGAGTRIERNYIFSNAGAGTWVYGIATIGAATRTHVIGNVICVGNASTCSVGIDMASDNGYMQMGICAENWLMEMPDAGGGVGAATLSKGINAAAGTLVTNNRIGIATEANGVTGGTAHQTFIVNYEPTNGGALLI